MYLVWNESITESEFFGVTKSQKKAERLLRKMKRERYPGMKEKEIEEYEVQNGESLKISSFDNMLGKA